MSVPANPTINALVLEGIKKAGEANPSAALVSRASTEWLAEINNDIWQLSKKPKLLQQTSYTIINQGQSRYAYPDDYSSDLSMTILYGNNQNTCGLADYNFITLNSSDNSGQEIVGKEILLMTGAAQSSYAQIVSYDSATKIAQVVPTFNQIPSSGDSYMIVDYEYPVKTKPVFEGDREIKLVAPMLPQALYPIGDDNEGYFVLNCPPNKTYGARLRYYADLTRIDTSSSLFSTILRKWRNVYVTGFYFLKLKDENDDRETNAYQEYQRHLRDLIYREIYGMDISNMTDRVSDYA